MPGPISLIVPENLCAWLTSLPSMRAEEDHSLVAHADGKCLSGDHMRLQGCWRDRENAEVGMEI